MNKILPSHIKTFTGQYIDVLNPDPAQIDLRDIIHGLSHQCRFGGHTRNFYSVAQHSVLVSMAEIPNQYRFQALMHDASEAYLGDIPTPIKRYLPEYKQMENKMMDAIALKFGFEYPLSPIVKHIDTLVTAWEMEALVNQKTKLTTPKLVPLSIEQSRTYFLNQFTKLAK